MAIQEERRRAGLRIGQAAWERSSATSLGTVRHRVAMDAE
jgi:hypothetical protein